MSDANDILHLYVTGQACGVPMAGRFLAEIMFVADGEPLSPSECADLIELGATPEMLETAAKFLAVPGNEISLDLDRKIVMVLAGPDAR